MERNPNDNLNSSGFGQESESNASGSGLGATGSGSYGGASKAGSGSGSYDSSFGAGSGGLADDAGVSRGAADLGGASGSTPNLGSATSGSKADAVREKAGKLRNTLADRLEAGAEKLRNTRGGVAGAPGGAAVATDDRLAQIGDSVATGMKGTADWLRDADLESLKTDVEKQVKEHPARSLLIAAGIGYLLAKAFRR